MRNLFFSAISVISFLLVSFGVGEAQDFGEILEGDWDLKPPAAYSDSDAMVIFDKGFALAELKGLELRRHVRVKVLKPSAVAKMTPVVIETKEYDDIGDVKALIHRPTGEVVKVDKEDIVEYNDEDIRSVAIPFEGLEPGDIYEYSYVINFYGGVDKLGADKYFLFSQATNWQNVKARKDMTVEWDEILYKNVTNLPSWYFDHPVFTSHSEFVVKLGAELDYTCMPSNLPVNKQQPVSRRGSGIIDRVYKYHTWVMEDIPPSEPEPFMPRPNDYRPSLHFELFSSPGENRIIVGRPSSEHWVYVGRNLQGYLNMYIKRPRGFKKLTLSLVKDLTSDQDRIRTICEYVRDEYDSDDRGWRLRPVHKNLREFYKKKTGAPFEANVLLLEMLKAIGVDAHPVLIATRDQVDFRRSGRFNHIIVLAKLDVGEIFLDASSSACPYGALPPHSLVGEGVVVDFDRSGVCEIQTEYPHSFRRDSVTIRMTADGAATGSMVRVAGGYLAMEVSDYLAAARSERPVARDYRSIQSFESTGEALWQAKDDGSYRVETELALLSQTDASGQSGVCPPAMSLFADQPFKSPVRLQAVDFVFPFKYEHVTVVESGSPLDATQLPKDLTFEATGALFHRSVAIEPERAVIAVEITIDRASFEPPEYTQLRTFLVQTMSAFSETVGLVQ